MGLLTDGYFSLAQDVNKVKPADIDDKEGVVSPLMDEFTLDLPDEELIKLKDKWELRWKNDTNVGILKKRQVENENYWKGKQYDADTTKSDRPFADNLIFQAVETFLPLATRQSPEPVVDTAPEAVRIADTVRKMLIYQSDRLRLKMKLQKVARHWSLYLVGAAKVGWDEVEKDITLKVIRPQKLILDPDASIEEGEYTGAYIGEYKTESAADIIKRFPKKKKLITELVRNKLGTEVTYIEWWTPKYLFYTLEQEVLAKYKNPHWNYEQTIVQTDEFGYQIPTVQEGKNHFAVPRMPYIFLSVFSLGEHPWEDTNIVQQNLNLQDLINKRQKQIDKNAKNTNSGLMVSGDHFTKEQAAQIDDALCDGTAIWVPSGDVNTAVNRTVAPPLPNFVYQALVDNRNELLNIFGIRGVTPQGIQNEDTVRGKIIIKGQDADRISLISENIEQFADEIFNWFVQLFYVYYDDAHTASVIGDERAKEYISLSKNDLTTKLIVSVKSGSMIPKDALTRANQAVELLQAGLLDPITAFEMMEFPNPRETAQKLFVWKSNPIALFPDLQSQLPAAPPPDGLNQPGDPSIPQGNPIPPNQLPVQNASPDNLNQVPIQ